MILLKKQFVDENFFMVYFLASLGKMRSITLEILFIKPCRVIGEAEVKLHAF